MPGSLGTLVTTITADASGFNSNFDAAAKRAQKFETETTASLSRVEEKLSGMRKGLASFREITELAFGFHVGRMFFEQLHEGLTKGIEGFSEARKAGEGFWESLVEGGKHILGLKTHYEELAAAEKVAAEEAKKLGDITNEYYAHDFGGGGFHSGFDNQIIGKAFSEEADAAAKANAARQNLFNLQHGGYAGSIADIQGANTDVVGRGRGTDEQIEAARKLYDQEAKRAADAKSRISDMFGDAEARERAFAFNRDLVKQDQGAAAVAAEQAAAANAFEAKQRSVEQTFNKSVDTLEDQLHPERVLQRRSDEIDDMLKRQRITQAEHDQAIANLGGIGMAAGGPTGRIQGVADIAKELQIAALNAPASVKPATEQGLDELKKTVADGTTAVVNAVKALAAAGGFSFG